LKATAIAHPIQGLIKYHGLKDPRQRIPYHDSISVCIQALHTTTTVQTLPESERNELLVNGKEPTPEEKRRIEIVLNKLKGLAQFRGNFKVISENSVKTGKGLGFSSSGFAALGVAASKALTLNIDAVSLSEIVRLGAGSSTRSLAGRFSIWYSNRKGRSYAEQLKAPKDIDFSMMIVPIHSDVKTDEAHVEALSSCLFRARLRNISRPLKAIKKAIATGDTTTIGRLAEEDTLNLHAITMTGRSHMVLWEPESVRIIKEVIRMREEGIPCWYSLDTGPSVFVNTYKENTKAVVSHLGEIGLTNVIASEVGTKPLLSSRHLF
jgi:phosphomevalonate decarboxylase